MAKSKPIIQIQNLGFKTLESNLQKIILHAVVEPAQEQVRRNADDIAFIAKELAPEKTGSLASAIEPAPNIGRKGYKVEASVQIRPSAYNQEEKKLVRKYAYDVHENVTPVGHKGLGKKSQIKNARIGSDWDGKGVGGGYLQRAIEYVNENISVDISKAIRNALAKYN